MKNNKFLIFVSMFLMLFVTTEGLFAKGGFRGGGSSFRSSSSRSSTRSTNRSTSTWGSSSRTSNSTSGTSTTTNRNSTSSNRSTTSNTSRQNLYNNAQKNGTVFQSRSAAVSSFKSANQSKYTSTYATEPTTRPSHIPQTYTTGGNTYNISYNSGYGGYGYMNSLGTWIMYDMFTDAVMLNSMMERQNYYYGEAPVVRTRSSLGFILTGAVVLLMVVLLVTALLD